MSDKENISCMRVAVRVRPMLNTERDQGNINVIHFFEDKPQMIAALDKPFTFDHIFPPHADQKKVYDELVQPLVDKLILGYNCTVFAYGSTGTGKTYTMGTSLQCTHEDGMVQRVLDYLFREVDSVDDSNIQISVSYIEIYVGKIYDLLRNVKKNISIKQARSRNGFVVTSTLQALQLLERGSHTRKTKKTSLNSGSSRSHALFTIHFKQYSEQGTVTSQMNLIDLAGSEGIRRTGAAGTLLQEGVTINRGLLALGKLIRDLSAKRPPSYRDDVLTSVLKDSVNTKSFVSMLVCVSPCDSEVNITIDSLRFAADARRTQLKPEQIRAFKEYRAANASKFEEIQDLIRQIPPTPAVTKYWNPTTNYNAKLSNISEASEESISITTSMSSSSVTQPETPALSPIVRKYLEELESRLDDKLNTIVESVVKSNKSVHRIKSPMFKPFTTPTNDSLKKSEYWSELCNEVRTIFHDEFRNIIESGRALMPLDGNKTNYDDSDSSPRTNMYQNGKGDDVASYDHARCRLNFDSDNQSQMTNEEPIFKVPEIPVRKRKPKQREELVKQEDEQPRRKSLRLSLKIDANIENTPNKAKSYKRDTNQFKENEIDISMIESPRNLRRSLRLSNVLKSIENTPEVHSRTPALKNSKKIYKQNYMDLCNSNIKSMGTLNVKNAKRIHKQHIIDTCNSNVKMLTALPTIGPKTAMQIYTYRMLNGNFETIDDLKRCPFWKGNAFNRFLIANNLPSEIEE